jgi:hypothetical protein
MSIASGFRAMIEAITTTNSGKPIGRCVDETQAFAFRSVTLRTSPERQNLGAMMRWTTLFAGWLVRWWRV